MCTTLVHGKHRFSEVCNDIQYSTNSTALAEINSNDDQAPHGPEEGKKLMCAYYTRWHVRVTFIPPRLSKQPHTTSLWQFYVPVTIKGTQVFTQSSRHSHPTATKFGSSRHILMEIASITFHENPSCGCQADTCGRTETGGRIDMTKLIRASRESANAPKSGCCNKRVNIKRFSG